MRQGSHGKTQQGNHITKDWIITDPHQKEGKGKPELRWHLGALTYFQLELGKFLVTCKFTEKLWAGVPRCDPEKNNQVDLLKLSGKNLPSRE